MSSTISDAKKRKASSSSSPLGVYRYTPQALADSYQALKQSPYKDDYLAGRAPGAVDTATALPVRPPPSREAVVVAATQLTAAHLDDSSVKGLCLRAEQAIATAVEEHGAHLVLLPELWCGPYFCQSQQACLQSLADPIHTSDDNDGNDSTSQNILLQRMQLLAKHYSVVLPISLYERCHNVLYNSVVMVDSNGAILGTYRKTHIPDGPGYQEKFYFSPGDTVGMGVFDTQHLGRIGVAICWDQWFPETARILALQGCELLLYPTAIGSEPQDVTIQSSAHWQRVMQGHAAANMIPVVASNRFGTEILMDHGAPNEVQRIHFYGKSFITDNTGAIVAEAPDNTTEEPVMVISSTLNLEQQRQERLAWGLFRDRRPDLYHPLLTKDGNSQK